MANRIDEQTAAARVRFVDLMQTEYPDDPGIPEFCRMLMRLSATHRRLRVEYRRRGETMYRKRAEFRCEMRIAELCAKFGQSGGDVRPFFDANQDDGILQLRLLTKLTDDFSQVHICVPAGRI